MSRRATRTLVRLGFLCVVAIWLVIPSPVAADTASDLDAARQRAAAAQTDANAAADDLSKAQGRYEALSDRVDELTASIGRTQSRVDELQTQVRERAVGAYVNRASGATAFESLFSTSSPMEAARRERLLDQANAADNRVTANLKALRADLDEQQAELEQQREAQGVVKDQMAAEYATVQATLADANRARDELAARLEREQAEAAAAEAARLRALQAASRPQPSGTSSGGGSGQIIANPGGGSFQCPVSGSAYSDNYGPRGSGFHYGIDMFAPTGVPVVAVKSGSVSYMAMNGAGGNEAYLAANDGNVYYYAHLSQFVGGPRAVSQGEVIGLVGSTGNSTAPHLHFEIRLGGANGQRIDPYPTLQSAGC